MNKIVYPTREQLRWWIEDLKGEDALLRLSLPLVDNDWYERVLEIIGLVQMPLYNTDLHKKAAIIFYKIAKAHNYIDGNKRSSIVVLYLFYLINRHYILSSSANDIKSLAKKVARSRGRVRYDRWISKISTELASHVHQFDF